MFHILGFLFVIIVVILVIGLSIIGTVLRTIFGLGGKRRSSSLLKEIIFIENTKNSSLKMKESMWILKKLKNNQTLAMPVRMYLPFKLCSFI